LAAEALRNEGSKAEDWGDGDSKAEDVENVDSKAEDLEVEDLESEYSVSKIRHAPRSPLNPSLRSRHQKMCT